MKKADQAIVDRIINALNANDAAVERAIIILGNLQTHAEQQCRNVLVHNGVGFSRAHATFGMWAYNILIHGGHLRGQALYKARKFALRYARTQLLEAAKEKATKQGAQE